MPSFDITMNEPTRSERFRTHAERCRRKAREVASREVRAQFELMARQWDELADEFHRHALWDWAAARLRQA